MHLRDLASSEENCISLAPTIPKEIGGRQYSIAFFDLLEAYEKASEPFDVYLPNLFAALAEYAAAVGDAQN